MGDFWYYLQNSDFVLFILCINGFFIGSFLNVLTIRLPIINKMADHCAVNAYIEKFDFSLKGLNETLPATIWGRSICPNCGEQIPFYYNIPIIGYLILNGRSSCCDYRIPLSYFLSELFIGVVTTSILLYFGISVFSLLWLWSFYLCYLIAIIDVKTLLIYDTLNYLLMWSGLLISALNIGFIPTESAIFGAIGAYIGIYVFNGLFKLSRGKEGIGHGDFKLLAAFGAWLGITSIPFILLSGSLIAILYYPFFKKINDGYFAFGPALCFGFLGYFIFKM